MEDIDFWVNFVTKKFKKIAKNWVWKEKSVEPSMCSQLGQPPCYTSHALYNRWERYEKKLEGREGHRGCSPHNNPGTHKMITSNNLITISLCMWWKKEKQKEKQKV